MDMPAGIMRKVRSSSDVSGRAFCEEPAHTVPESPLDVASDFGSCNGESVPGKEVESEADVGCTQVDGSICCAESEASSGGTDGCSGDQDGGDGRTEEGCSGGGSMGSQSGAADADGEEARSGNVVVGWGPDLDKRMEAGVSRDVSVGVELEGTCVATGGEGRVGRRSVGCSPERVVAVKNAEMAPVNIISATSYYVEGPSKAEMLRDGKSTQRRTSFCRIEAFVVRSRSTRRCRCENRDRCRHRQIQQGEYVVDV